MPRTYAEDTSVPVSRSREEIGRLLREWRCDAIQWTDDFLAGRVQLRFRWEHEGVVYHARMEATIPPRDAIRRDMASQRSRGVPTDAQVDAAQEQRSRAIHRLLALKLKADLNCVRAGLFSAIDVFLPHVEGNDGRTVAEVAGPRLRALLSAPAVTLLAGEK